MIAVGGKRGRAAIVAVMTACVKWPCLFDRVPAYTHLAIKHPVAAQTHELLRRVYNRWRIAIAWDG